MKKTIIYIMFIVVGTLCSCSKFLDKTSSTEVRADILFETQYGFESALMDCYIKMGSETLWGKELSYCAIESLAQNWALDQWNFPAEQAYKTLDFTNDYCVNTFASIYESLYNIIASSNNILINLKETGSVIENEDVRNVIEAEALTIRAFMHSEVLRLYGEMPIANPSIEVSLRYAETVDKDAVIPFYSNDEFIKKINADIDAAEALFVKSDPAVENIMTTDNDETFLIQRRIRFNIHALRGLRARLAMHVGDKTKAYDAAMSVINAVNSAGEKIIDLTAKQDVVSKYFTLPTESLFILGTREFDGNNIFNGTSGSKYYITDATLNEVFGDDKSLDLRYKYQWNTENVGSTGNDEPLLVKYNSEESIQNNQMSTNSNIIPIIRLAEMYLIAVECAPTIAESAELFLTYISSRDMPSYAPLTESNMEKYLEEQYRREFFAEGQLFYFYKRKFFKRMLFGNRVNDLQENNYVVPLPDSEMVD